MADVKVGDQTEAGSVVEVVEVGEFPKSGAKYALVRGLFTVKVFLDDGGRARAPVAGGWPSIEEAYELAGLPCQKTALRVIPRRKFAEVPPGAQS